MLIPSRSAVEATLCR